MRTIIGAVFDTFRLLAAIALIYFALTGDPRSPLVIGLVVVVLAGIAIRHDWALWLWRRWGRTDKEQSW